MAGSLGILLSDSEHLEKVIRLCRAARRKDIQVTIFLTHTGVLLTQESRFGELVELAKVSLCNVGFESHGLKRPTPGIDEKDYATQARNAELIEDCDRYVVF
jgi:hypothetical protein